MNATQTLTSAQRAISSAASGAADLTRKSLYAGLGMVAVVQEEASRAFSGFVTEGRKVKTGSAGTLTARAYTDARTEVVAVRTEAAAAVESAEQQAEEAGRRAEQQALALEDRVAAAVTRALQRMNVPTREDVDALRQSVERLDRKTAALRGA
jgi:poly(hydroxyalkanoate) granule-associated protein